MLHNISITCPLITTFIANCYMEPARLFVEQHYNKAVDVFMVSKVKVTSEGKRHLGAVIVKHSKFHMQNPL